MNQLIGQRGPDHLMTDDMVSSRTGLAVAKASEAQRHYRNQSLIFDPPARRELKREIRSLASEFAHSNWDGEGADPVDALTVTNAIRFIDSLSMGLPEPEPGVHPDGEFVFEWIGRKGHRLSISINATGRMAYAFRHLPRKNNGTEWLGDQIPEQIIKYITSFLPR